MWYQNLGKFKEANGYQIDGIWYPRVTSIISIKAKPALYAFYASMPDFKTGEAIKVRSAEQGTLIHDTVEAILKNETPPIPQGVAPAINVFNDFLKRNEIVVHKVEERIVSKKHHYSGTIDILADVNGKLGVLDIKTSKAIYRDFNLQTSAYVEALRENPNMPVLTRWILRIDQTKKCLKCGATMRNKGGNEKISPPNGGRANNGCVHEWSEMQGDLEFKEITSFDADISGFLACKSLWEWENDYWLRQI